MDLNLGTLSRNEDLKLQYCKNEAGYSSNNYLCRGVLLEMNTAPHYHKKWNNK